MSRGQSFFASRWGVLFAMLGLAVGTGNIWRFPRIVAQYGGAFFIPWLIFLFIWAIPLIVIEFSMGRRTRMGTVGAFSKVMGRRYAWMGGFVALCSIAIMFYYSVVTGWCLKYILASLEGTLPGGNSPEYWQAFSSSAQPMVFHLAAVAIGAFVILHGVKGIETANRVMIPSLFLLLVIAMVRALTLPGAGTGLNYLFKPDLSRLGDYRLWLDALTQIAWSTGAGWGLLLTYGIYLRREDDITLNSFLTGFGDCSASLLAGMAVLPTIFALLPPPEAMQAVGAGNTGLTFIWIPQLFAQMPFGSLFMFIFFVALFLAALTSLISMIELAVRNLIDLGVERRRATLIVSLATALLGLPSALSLSFLNNQDWVWGIGLMISGFFFALAARRYPIPQMKRELAGERIRLGAWFDLSAKHLIPVLFAVLVAWWLGQSVYQYASGASPDPWWDPLGESTLGTCIFQWGLAILLLLGINGWLASSIRSPQAIDLSAGGADPPATGERGR